ncbi:hypothetical protein [Streptomyces cyaneofuscatus]|uniref:hypothetical protein n=1 Tax=Streptomyces cyaneofuscatus TaxID=66883 RepID=UPI0036580375
MRKRTLGERHRLPAERIAAGMMPQQAAETLGMAPQAMTALVDDLQRSFGVFTLRSLSFRLVSQGFVPFPGPHSRPRLDPVTEQVWAALRWDILDVELVPVLATTIRVRRSHIQMVIDQLCETHETSLHGLIGPGFARGVLSGNQSVTPPQSTAVRPSPPGTGAWDPAPSQRRVLALRASGRDTAACAREEATTTSAITWRIGRCREMAGVDTGRALMHAALRDRVLLPPEVTHGLEPAGGERAVWQCLPLDVPDIRLPAVISNHTGLSINTVHGYLRRLRVRYRTDEAAIYAGWKLGVITADTRTQLPDRQPPPPLPAPAPRPAAQTTATAATAPMKVSGRQHKVLTLLTVEGMSLTEAAAHLKVRPTSVRAHERSCLRRAEVATLRALTHRSLSMGLLDPLDAGDRDPGAVPGDAEAVWRCLPADVPDGKLIARIARMTGLSETRVMECLDLLRATGLTDPQLIAVGWHRRILTALPAEPAGAGPVITQQTRPGPPARPDDSRLDPLLLLPGTPPELSGGLPPWGTSAVAGRKLDFVRISASTCRLFLSRIPATRWGPVLGLPEVREALLLTRAEPRPVRRGQGARLVRPGADVALPAPDARTGPGGRYWAVGPQAPLWEQGDLAWLLEHSTLPMPALTGGTAR